MECDRNGLSDERIGEALIKEVIEEGLREEHEAHEAPILPLSTNLRNEVEEKLVTQMGKMVRIVGDRLRNDTEFQDAIDGMNESPGSMTENWQLVIKLFEEHGQITWEWIAVLFYVAGRMAVKVMEAHLPAQVIDIFKLTVDYFKTKLLGWVQRHGGWINSLSELCGRVQVVSHMSPHKTKHILIFIAGLAFGSIITWKLARGT